MEESEQVTNEMSNLQQQMMIPLGRALLPEEVAENKAKGREWSRLVKVKGKKMGFTEEELANKKEKNRLRQKRFRERQRTKEAAEENARINAQTYQAPTDIHQQHVPPHNPHSPHPHQSYPSEPDLGYDVTQNDAQQQHEGTPNLGHDEGARQSPMDVRQESTAQKRKRLGRERQARFREKKRTRSTNGSPGQPGDEISSQADVQQSDVMTLAELQKLSAQLSGYYLGLTQGLSQDAHQAVMRSFFDGLREELGDELVTNVASLAILDAQHQAQLAAAVQAHAPYVNQLHAQSLAQGLDVSNLHAFQVQVALAASQMPQQDIQGHLQGNPQLASGQDADQMQGHIGHMVMHPASSQGAQVGNIPVNSQYHRGSAEQLQADTASQSAHGAHTENHHTPQASNQHGPHAQNPTSEELHERPAQGIPAQDYPPDHNHGQYSDDLQNSGRYRESQDLNNYVVGTEQQAYPEHEDQNEGHQADESRPILHNKESQMLYTQPNTLNQEAVS